MYMTTLSNNIKTLRNQVMKKLISHIGVLHASTFSKYQDTVINKNKVNVLKINDKLDEIEANKHKISGKVSSRKMPTVKDEPKRKEPKEKKMVMVQAIFYTEKEGKGGKRQTRDTNGMRQMGGIRNIMIPNSKTIKKLKNKKIKANTKEFKKIIKRFEKDEAFATWKADVGHYWGMVYVVGIADAGDSNAVVDLLDDELQDAKKSIYSQYVNTKLNKDEKDFQNMVESNGKVYECVINCLMTHYPMITKDEILRVIKKTDISNGISINEFKIFFEHYRLPAVIYDPFMHVLFKHEPESRNSRMIKFVAMVKDKHIYTINHQKDKLAQTQPKPIEVKANPNFKIIEKENQINYVKISSVEDIANIIKNHEVKKELTVINGITTEPRLLGLYKDIRSCGYDPHIQFEAHNELSSISLMFHDEQLLIIIKKQYLEAHSMDGDLCVDDIGVYQKCHVAKDKFYMNLFQKNHMSHYSETDKEIFKNYRTVAQYGLFDEFEMKNKEEIDVCKAYTASLMEIKKIPVFNEFDQWKEYDGHEIEDLTYYLVEADGNGIFYNARFNTVYGKYLKHCHARIISFKRPSMVYDVDYSHIINDLYSTTISNDAKENKYLQKLIANVNIGVLGKLKGNSQKSMIFERLEEANTYSKKYGGQVIPLIDYRINDESDVCSSSCFGYALVFKETISLNNGFLFIRDLLIQTHNYKMHCAHKLLEDNGVDVLSVKTDAFIIHKSKLETAKSLLNFGSDIGCWRNSKSDDALPPTVFYSLKQNDLIDIPKLVQFVDLEIEDEYDTDKMVKMIEEKKRVMIRADLAGSGKSYVCEAVALKHKTIFVTTTNKLCQKYQTEGFANATLFAVFGDRDFIKDYKTLDISEYDCVVFDEILFASMKFVRKIKQMVERNPEKIFIGTGDTKQLPSVGIWTNTMDEDEYKESCINQIFNFGLFLKECKRVKSEEDKQKIKQIKHDIFNGVSFPEIIRKYFKTTDKVITKTNITYKNETAEKVSRLVRCGLKLKDEYTKDETIICKQHFRLNPKQSIKLNFEYKILEVHTTHLVICDIAKNDDVYSVPLNQIRSKFIYGYAFTCHSAQGCSIKKKYTIFDWQQPYVTPQWFWTAVTRCIDFNNVYFYTGDIMPDPKFAELEPLLNERILNYKLQDKKAGRKYKENEFVSSKWIFQKLYRTCCRFCGDVMTHKNFSVNRLDNSFAHIASNIELTCVTCNCMAR